MINYKQIIRNDWQRAEVQGLFDLPFNDLLFKAHCVHMDNFDPNQVQVSTLLSIKTGACLLYTSPSPRDQRGSRMPSCG